MPFPPALLVSELPTSSSVDDLTVVVGQFARVERVLLEAPGARGGAGSALVFLADAHDGARLLDMAEDLDGYPVAGGLLSVSVCSQEEARSWLEGSLLGAELTQLLRGNSSAGSGSDGTGNNGPSNGGLPRSPDRFMAAQPLRRQAAAPLPLSPGQPRPTPRLSPTHLTSPESASGHALPVPAPAAPPPSSSSMGGSGSRGSGAGSGAAALEADFRALQLQLQQQQQQAARLAEQEKLPGRWDWGNSDPGVQHPTAWDALKEGSGDSEGGASEATAGELLELTDSMQQQMQPAVHAVHAVHAAHSWSSSEGSVSWDSRDGEGDGGWSVASGPAVRRGRGGGGSGGGAAASHSPGGGSGGSPPAGATNIIVRNILQELAQPTLKAFFKQFGRVVELIKFPEVKYCFVHYDTPEAATAAVCTLDGRMVPELNPLTPVEAQYRSGTAAFAAMPGRSARPHSGREAGIEAASLAEGPSTKLWVGNLALHATLDTLAAVFGKFGAVHDLQLQQSSGARPGNGEQWGFVNFRRVDEAQAAVKALSWSETQLSGRLQLRIEYK